MEKRLGQLYYFNGSNPTGHYRLNLSIEFERLVAVKICEVNTVERLGRRLEGKMDLTQKGNWENFRYETYNGVGFVYDNLWKIPTSGTFEFDYVSTVRPESEATPMEDYDFKNFVVEYINLENSNDIQEEELKEIFVMFDKDGGGTVGLDELIMIMKSLGQVMSGGECQDLLESMDDDGSGEIEFDEFMELWTTVIKKVKQREPRAKREPREERGGGVVTE